MIRPGRIVEFIEHKQVFCGVVLNVRKDRLQVLTELGKEISLPDSRIIQQAEDSGIDLSSPRDRILSELRKTSHRREDLGKKVSAPELWELLQEEGGHFDDRTLAELCFGERITSDHTSAVIRAMLKDRVYFKFRVNRFIPNDPQTVEKILTQARREEEKKKEIEEGAAWIRSLMAGKPTTEPECKERIIGLLKELAIGAEKASRLKQGLELLSKAGLSGHQNAFPILVRLGIWDENENLELHRLGIRPSFSQKVLDEARRVILSAAEPRADDSEDLTDLEIFTIDHEETADIDDGLSFCKTGEGFEVGIHITDVSHFIEVNSALDLEALSRGTSIYLPDIKIPMLPPAISEGLCSLLEDKPRRSLTVMVRLSESGEVGSFRIMPSLIRVKRRMTYDEVNLRLQDEPDLKELYELSLRLRQNRVKKGALLLPLPEIMVKVNRDAEISVERRDRESPADVIVSEMMILCNWLCGRYLMEKGVPALFKGQSEPKEVLMEPRAGDLYTNYKQRKLLSRAETSLSPSHHAGLGLEVYTNTTSPLRRYIDLVMHRQLKAAIKGTRAPFGVEELRETAMKLEPHLTQIAAMEHARKRYWILKYLQQRKGQQTKALVIDEYPRRYQLLLTDYMLETSIPKSLGAKIQEREFISVRIISSNPRRDVLTVEPC